MKYGIKDSTGFQPFVVMIEVESAKDLQDLLDVMGYLCTRTDKETELDVIIKELRNRLLKTQL